MSRQSMFVRRGIKEQKKGRVCNKRREESDWDINVDQDKTI